LLTAIYSYANDIFNKLAEDNYFVTYDYDKKLECLVDLFADINALHSFREGNGRSQREFIEELAKINGIYLDLTPVPKKDMIIASHESINGDYDNLTKMFKKHSKILNKEEQFYYIELYILSESLINKLKDIVNN